MEKPLSEKKDHLINTISIGVDKGYLTVFLSTRKCNKLGCVLYTIPSSHFCIFAPSRDVHFSYVMYTMI